jgi:hypothetical protein
MPRRLGDQGEQHELQILAAEFAAAREAVVVAEAAIAAAAPKRGPSAVTMPVTADRMPKLVEKRGVSEAAVAAPLMAVSGVRKMIVAVAVLSLGECIVPVAPAVPMVVLDFVCVLVMMGMHMAKVAAKLGQIPSEMAIGCVKTVSHGSLPQE